MVISHSYVSLPEGIFTELVVDDDNDIGIGNGIIIDDNDIVVDDIVVVVVGVAAVVSCTIRVSFRNLTIQRRR